MALAHIIHLKLLFFSEMSSKSDIKVEDQQLEKTKETGWV